MPRLIQWDTLDVRINGDKLNAFVQSMRVAPIERLQLDFQNGLLRVSGAIRKIISVPFSVDIREILANGRSVRVPLRSASAFGGIPIPHFLFRLMKRRLPELVGYENPATLIVSLDRFLPAFIDAEIQTIWIIDGGLAVTLGRGGADLPESMEDPHGRDTDRSDRVAE
jgi:hypothetical protein